MEREKLYERIDKRVEKMLEMGLADEVKSILSLGADKRSTCMQAIGYKEIARFLDGEMPLADAAELIKRESRRYAKRQMTWFRRNSAIKWIDVTNE